jgi:hypothetical protein
VGDDASPALVKKERPDEELLDAKVKAEVTQHADMNASAPQLQSHIVKAEAPAVVVKNEELVEDSWDSSAQVIPPGFAFQHELLSYFNAGAPAFGGPAHMPLHGQHQPPHFGLRLRETVQRQQRQTQRVSAPPHNHRNSTLGLHPSIASLFFFFHSISSSCNRHL